MSHELLLRLIGLAEISSAALVLVLLLRPLLSWQSGPALTYASWLLVPLTLVASMFPHSTTSAPVFSLTLPSAAIAGAMPSVPLDNALISSRTWLLTWLVGALAATALMVWQQLRFHRSLGRMQSMGIAYVYRATDNSSVGPLLLGLLQPRIVLPADFDIRYTTLEQTLILAHERVHLQRGDLFANALASAMQIAFWFNPLVHFATSRFRFDQELACDMVVVRQHPGARQTYASAILKTQLISAGLPIGCHWQSRHPLKERIMQLTRNTPHRTRRLASLTLLSGLTLAACYGAWASEQTQPDVASLAIPAMPSSSDRYQVSLAFTQEVPGESKSTRKVDLPVQSGRHTYLYPNKEDPQACNISLDIKPLQDDMVEINMPFRCADSEQQKPKLWVQLGKSASLKFGKGSPGAIQYTIAMVVTRWPESVPWPQGQ